MATLPNVLLCKVWRLNIERNHAKLHTEKLSLEKRIARSCVAYHIFGQQQCHAIDGSANGRRKWRAKLISPSLLEEQTLASCVASKLVKAKMMVLISYYKTTKSSYVFLIFIKWTLKRKNIMCWIPAVSVFMEASSVSYVSDTMWRSERAIVSTAPPSSCRIYFDPKPTTRSFSLLMGDRTPVDSCTDCRNTAYWQSTLTSPFLMRTHSQHVKGQAMTQAPRASRFACNTHQKKNVFNDDDDDANHGIRTTLWICWNILCLKFCHYLKDGTNNMACAFLCILGNLCFKCMAYSIWRPAPHMGMGILAIELAIIFYSHGQ